MYNVLICCTLYADNLRQLKNDSTKLRQLLGRNDIGIVSATYIQDKVYRTTKPLLNDCINEWHSFDKRALGCVFPFTSSNINHRNGIFIGYNMDSGLPIMYDTFDENLDNYNMVVFARSGAGKSVFMKVLSARSATFDDIMTISIDIEPEYIDICEVLGGVNIKVGGDSNTIINFFDVTPEIVKNPLNHKEMEMVKLDDKINSVTSILLTMAKGYTNENQEFYNDISRSLIKKAVSKVYEDKGITKDPNSLMEKRETTIVDNRIVGGLCRKEMPTITDWYNALKEDSDKNNDDTYKKYYDYLLLVMKEYCQGMGGNLVCFDGQSTVKLGYDLPFINFDVSSLNEQSELPLAQHIICDYIWENIVKRNDKGHKIRVLIDEAWRLATIINGKPKFPEALEFLNTMFRRARKKNTSTVVISQQFSEFYNKQTEAIIKNADTKVFLPPDKTSIDDIVQVFHLTQGELEFLKQAKRGEALIKCNSASAKLKVDVPGFEMQFVQTNQNSKNEKERGSYESIS